MEDEKQREAHSKLEGSYVCTFLLNLAAQDVRFPLAQFQATKADKEDTKKLLESINKAQGDEGLSGERLDEVFEKWWPDLNAAISQITPMASAEQLRRRSTEDVLEEIVSTIRENSHTQSTILNEVRTVRIGLVEDSEQAFPWEPQTGQGVGNAFAYRMNYTRPQGGVFITPYTGSTILGGESPLVLKTSTQNIPTEKKEPNK